MERNLQPVAMERTIDLAVLWNRLWAFRRPVAIFVLVATLATGTVAFLLPPWYTATSSLLPPGEEEWGFGITRRLRGVSVPGIKIPTPARPAEVFLSMLESRRLVEGTVNRLERK